MKFRSKTHAVGFWLNIVFCLLNLGFALFGSGKAADVLLSFMVAVMNGTAVMLLWPEGK